MSSLDEIRQVRLQKKELLETSGMQIYPARAERSHTCKEILEQHEQLSTDQATVSIAGRVMAIRGQGGISFIPVFDGTETVQVVFKEDAIAPEIFTLFREGVDIGDFVQVVGTPFTTERGAQSVLVSGWTMISKTLIPLPEKWHGLQDMDARYRKRYLDILMDDKVRKMFEQKTAFWRVMRDFLEARGFLEVETPTLEVTTGGAEATPFQTHHNDFDIDVYLRISVGELWQKRLMAAGIPKTFEIGRAYRNEGSSPDHLQEFTNMEFYWAYANYRDGMELTRELYRHIAQEVFGTTVFTTRGHTFDLSDQWQEIDYQETILERTGVDILTASKEVMEVKLRELGVVYEGETKERLIDTLWKYCRKDIAGPAFLMHHPKIVSPLAKESQDRPGFTERFQVLLAGSEVGNGYSELNDPIEQRARFEEQQELLASGDTEAMMPEWDFVEMLEHGMPPTCGFGVGERLFAFLVDKPIRETVMFPLMKPRLEGPQKKKESRLVTIILNKNAFPESWQRLNTVAHLSASFAARHECREKDLFIADGGRTLDGEYLHMNIGPAMVIRDVDASETLHELRVDARKKGLEVAEFTRSMLETSNDKKQLANITENNSRDIELLGVLMYGARSDVDELTSSLPLST
ncbi:MAG: lysyl-tRNA synthetase class 2 [Planctomycetota bacterium]|jgi:lysyl-tRNA synthetase class 2